MPIPKAKDADIPQEKLTGYLLNEEHPVGKSKAKWFRSLGYELSHWWVLENDLLELVGTSDDYFEKQSPFGTKYVVNGTLKPPNGGEPVVVTVWIIEEPEEAPRFVTAFPGDKK